MEISKQIFGRFVEVSTKISLEILHLAMGFWAQISQQISVAFENSSIRWCIQKLENS